ncbi:MAG: tetratricopeptide repeat protein [Bacteroidales bacterium]|nr:tetratricopeptide repeat protein [Bacteroidales bacterium]
MEQKNTRENTEMGDVIQNAELFIEQNQKKIIIIVAAIIVVVIGIFGLRKVSQNRNAKANAEMFAAEQWFAQDEYQTALDGNTVHAGFAEVAKKYGRTKAGNRAKYCAGICQMNLGNYNEALKYFNSYKGKDQITSVEAIILQGDAELELGNNGRALKNYLKAAKKSDNFITAPAALFKAGMVYYMEGNNAKAKECFEQIKTKYPESTEYSTIDKYIGITEAAE